MKEIRKHFRLNQTEMADKLGISQSQLSKLENGENQLAPKHLLVLYKMGVNLNWLISGEGEMLLSDMPDAGGLDLARRKSNVRK